MKPTCSRPPTRTARTSPITCRRCTRASSATRTPRSISSSSPAAATAARSAPAFFSAGRAIAPGANALPKFDGVSGVSAGSFIAPFAFLGTHADYETMDQLFRDPKPDWVEAARPVVLSARERELRRRARPRTRHALADRPAIRRANRTGGRRRTARAADSGDRHGQRHGSRLRCRRRRARRRQARRSEILSDILLASAAIPGAFPPREIEGRLYADGGIASNFFYGGPMDERDTFGATWRRDASGRARAEDALLGDHQRIHPADSGHGAADVAGDRRAQPLRVGALGGSHRAAPPLCAGGGDAGCAATAMSRCAGSPCRRAGSRSTTSPSTGDHARCCRTRASASAPTPIPGTPRRRDLARGPSPPANFCQQLQRKHRVRPRREWYCRRVPRPIGRVAWECSL